MAGTLKQMAQAQTMQKGKNLILRRILPYMPSGYLRLLKLKLRLLQLKQNMQTKINLT